MDGCRHYHEYISAEVEAIGKRIEEVRLGMSLELGRDATKQEAQTRYMESLLEGNAKEFREHWCSKCVDRSDCETKGDT